MEYNIILYRWINILKADQIAQHRLSIIFLDVYTKVHLLWHDSVLCYNCKLYKPKIMWVRKSSFSLIKMKNFQFSKGSQCVAKLVLFHFINLFVFTSHLDTVNFCGIDFELFNFHICKDLSCKTLCFYFHSQ